MIQIIYPLLLIISQFFIGKEDINDGYCNSLINNPNNIKINYISENIAEIIKSVNSTSIDYYSFLKQEISNNRIKFFFYKKICIITEEDNCILIYDKPNFRHENYIFIDPKMEGRCENSYFFNYFSYLVIIFCINFKMMMFSKFVGFFSLLFTMMSTILFYYVF